MCGATSCVDRSELRQPSSEDGAQLPTLADQHRVHLEEFYHWRRYFDNFLERHLEQNDILARGLMELAFKTTNMHLTTALAGDLTIYDKRSDDLEDIVNLCEKSLIQLHRTSNEKVVVTFDSVTVLPLCFAALCCRAPRIPKRAINLLLSWTSREGISNSLFAGRSAEWIVSTEEENMVNGYVPGWARIGRVGTTFSLLDRRAELVCQQPVMTPEGKMMRERRRVITW